MKTLRRILLFDDKSRILTEHEHYERLLEQAELERVLVEGVGQIPEIERTVLSLWYKEKLTLREIAEVVNLSKSRVSRLKSQAVLRLRSHVASHWPAFQRLAS